VCICEHNTFSVKIQIHSTPRVNISVSLVRGLFVVCVCDGVVRICEGYAVILRIKIHSIPRVNISVSSVRGLFVVRICDGEVVRASPPTSRPQAQPYHDLKWTSLGLWAGKSTLSP